jgi:hypothetical protein
VSGVDDGDRPVTARELADLQSALDELRTATNELKDARTTEAKREARGDVADAEADLDKVAKSLGISREALERATKNARDAERKDELKPILRDLLKEIADEDAASGDGDGDGDEGKGKTKPKPKPKAKAKDDGGDDDSDDGDGAGDPPPGDEGPKRGHWSERSIGDLVR